MKLQKISDIRPTLGFTEYDFIQKYRDSFNNSELGRIYDQLPLKEIGEWFMGRLPKKNPQGNKPMFPIEGEIALRNRLARVMKIEDLQTILYGKWKNDLKDKDVCMTDATCYENHLRYPTDIKLLWKCCEWLNALMHKTCKELKERCPRNKYNDMDKARLAYAKQRKPS